MSDDVAVAVQYSTLYLVPSTSPHSVSFLVVAAATSGRRRLMITDDDDDGDDEHQPVEVLRRGERRERERGGSRNDYELRYYKR